MSASPFLTVLRSLCHLAVVVSVAIWGFSAHAFPLPALLWGIGGTLLAVLVWALFLSPRAVFHTDRFGAALIELLFLAGGMAAMFFAGTPVWAIVLFGLVAMTASYVALIGRRDPETAPAYPAANRAANPGANPAEPRG